jgi:NDP-sugar pyrophosphorylase family protein
MSVQVVIQAGGRGERLRPLTLETPKPLVPVAGMPMVERLIRQMCDAGLRQFIVLTSWLGDRVIEHLARLEDLPSDVKFEFQSEDWGLGTIGGCARLAPCRDPVVLAFGDLVTDMRFDQLLAVHQGGGAAITLASHTESYRLRLGEIVEQEGRVTAYREKPELHHLICSGIAVFEPGVVDLVPLLSPPVGLGDVVNRALEQGYEVQHWRHNALWFDVNDPEELERATKAVASNGTYGGQP